MVDSHAKCNDGFSEDFAWRSVVQSFAWPIIETLDDNVQFGLGYGSKVEVLGQEPAHQPIGVFIGGAFTGTVGVREVNTGIEMLLEFVGDSAVSALTSSPTLLRCGVVS